MIVVLLNAYIALLALFVWLKFIPFNTFWKLSPVIVLLLLLVGLFIPMGWGAPSGPVGGGAQLGADRALRRWRGRRGARYGEHAGQGRRRAVPHRSDHLRGAGQGDRGPAQVRRAAPVAVLRAADAATPGRAFDVQQREAEVQQLQAQLEGAKWNLDRTTVRAPADGYVTNLALRKGARVTAQSPVMAFIDTSETIFGGGDRADLRPLHRSRPAGRDHVQDLPGRGLRGTRRGRAAGHRDRADAARRSRRRAVRRFSRRRSSSASGSTTGRSRNACLPEAPASRRSSPSTSRQPCHPQGRAAPDGHRELHQSVLMLWHDPRRDRLHAGHCANTLSLSIVSIWCR